MQPNVVCTIVDILKIIVIKRKKFSILKLTNFFCKLHKQTKRMKNRKKEKKNELKKINRTSLRDS